MCNILKMADHRVKRKFWTRSPMYCICRVLCMSDSLSSVWRRPRPGSVVVERLPDMREVGGSIPGCVKQKTLKFEVLLLCFSPQHIRVRDRLAGSESG